MYYAKVIEEQVVEYPILQGDLMLRFPDKSFTTPFDPPDGYVKVKETTPPYADHTQNAIEVMPLYIEGQWIQQWVLNAAAEDEVAERTLTVSRQMRETRNIKLQKTDWTQLRDAPVDATVWATYRQALRDITSQDGFPWEITWPEEPAA